MRSLAGFLCGLFALLAGAPLARAAETSGVELYEGLTVVRPLPAAVLQDRAGALSVDDVFAKSELFRPLDAGFRLTPDTSVYWLRVNVVASHVPEAGWLFLAGRDWDSVQVFLPQGRTYRAVRSGSSVRTVERDLVSDELAFWLPLTQGRELTFFVRYEGVMTGYHAPTAIAPSLESGASFLARERSVQYAQGAYAGLLLAMLVYNLFLLIGTRDRTYAYYVLYTLFFGLIWVSRAGQGWEYLWSFSYGFEKVSSFVFIILAIVFGVLFGRRYLKTQQHAPQFHTFFGGVAAAAVVCGAIGFLGFWGPAQTLLALTALVASIASLAGGAIVYSRGFAPARWFLIAWAALVVANVAYILAFFGILPVNFLTRYGPQIGSGLDMLLLAFGLADRINLAEKEKAIAQVAVSKGLEREVKQRTADLELEKRKAEEARALAEAANRAKSNFLAAMSHELRTPLNAIIGYAEILKEEAVEIGESGLVTDIERIRTAGRHLLGLINGVLDLSKIEAGKMELEVQTFSVPDLLREVIDTIRPLLEKNANRLEVQGVDGLGTMWTDVTKLRQILLNVLSNATKFTQAGTVKLVAYVEPSSGGDRIVFRISDTGLGMTPEQKARIFEAFVQADAGHTRRFGGTGLGLAISKRFCQMMGGEIEVESAPGKGSTFTLRIPRRAPEKSIAPRPPGSSGGNASLTRGAVAVKAGDSDASGPRGVQDL